MESLKMLPDGRMDSNNASLYVGLKPKTLAMKRGDGTGPAFVKVGGRIFYFKDDLDAWVRKCRVTSTAQARCAKTKSCLEPTAL
jgi:hypothetical protein